ncbi:hypothetical protein BC941DRAFT_71067 [Chlamydoabsidia padenii]|nr:hypothetical protein BC941DRAFT_71067 [Chlamydoabsidia padenii]
MSQSSTDFYDEEFGFKCKRINRRRLQSVVSTTTNEDDHNDQENIIGHNYDYDNDNDLNNKDTSNKKRSKGKGVSTGNTFKQVDFNYLRNPVLSPISPYTPHSQEQQLPSSFITVTTLSPEHTGPQTAHDTTTPTFDSTLLYDIDSTDNVDFTFEESEPVTPPTLAQPSLELLPPDETEVPNFERLRNQLIKTWQHNIEKRLFNVDGIDDTDENDLRRAMEKLANHDFSPYVSQHSMNSN